MSRFRMELLLYELLDESKDMDELNQNADFILDCLRMAILDLCQDNEWDQDGLDNDVM